jgi:hypothetical protein
MFHAPELHSAREVQIGNIAPVIKLGEEGKTIHGAAVVAQEIRRDFVSFRAIKLDDDAVVNTPISIKPV